MAEPATAKPLLRPLAKIPPPLANQTPRWNMQEVQGRLTEISEPCPIAALSFALSLAREVHEAKQLAAWISLSPSMFFPPDAQNHGIDLRNFPVLRMDDIHSVGKASETLLRSGAFRLLILDLGKNHGMPMARLSQLHGLTRKHLSCVVFVTERQNTEQSVGSLVSLHGRTSRKSIGDGRFICTIDVLRDKVRGCHWSWDICLAGIDGYY